MINWCPCYLKLWVNCQIILIWVIFVRFHSFGGGPTETWPALPVTQTPAFSHVRGPHGCWVSLLTPSSVHTGVVSQCQICTQRCFEFLFILRRFPQFCYWFPLVVVSGTNRTFLLIPCCSRVLLFWAERARSADCHGRTTGQNTGVGARSLWVPLASEIVCFKSGYCLLFTFLSEFSCSKGTILNN